MSHIEKIITIFALVSLGCVGAAAQAQDDRSVQQPDRSVPPADLSVHSEDTRQPTADTGDDAEDGKPSRTISTSTKWAPKVAAPPVSQQQISHKANQLSLPTSQSEGIRKKDSTSNLSVSEATQLSGTKTRAGKQNTGGAVKTKSSGSATSYTDSTVRDPWKAAENDPHDGFTSALKDQTDGFSSPFSKSQPTFENRFGFSEQNYTPETAPKPKHKAGSQEQPLPFADAKSGHKDSKSKTDAWNSSNTSKSTPDKDSQQ